MMYAVNGVRPFDILHVRLLSFTYLMEPSRYNSIVEPPIKKLHPNNFVGFKKIENCHNKLAIGKLLHFNLTSSQLSQFDNLLLQFPWFSWLLYVSLVSQSKLSQSFPSISFTHLFLMPFYYAHNTKHPNS